MTSFLLRAHLALGATMLGASALPGDALAGDSASGDTSAEQASPDTTPASPSAALGPVLTLDDPATDKLLSPLSRLRSWWS